MEPEEPNGVILNYTIKWTNGDDEKTATSSATEYDIPDLTPNFDYNVTIAAWTVKGMGQFFSPTVQEKTGIAEPQQVTNIKTFPEKTQVNVTWELDIYPGPTNYTVKVTDREDSARIQYGYSSDFFVENALVSGLDIYWNYNVEVTANTIKGDSPPATAEFRTQESKPGQVTDVKSNKTEPANRNYPEHCRKMSVSWTVPTKREQHGHIKYFTVNYTDQQGISKLHDVTANCNDNDYCTESESRNTVITVEAEKTYTAEVTTRTDSEVGDPVPASGYANMGACFPPAPQETGDTTNKVRGGQPEQNTITVQLDCNFYNNAASGSIIRRGLIAREENNDRNPQDTFVSDADLRQTYSFYGREKNEPLNPWQIDVKVDRFTGCSTGANRRKKRATTSVPFKVGEDSSCTGDANPCNGPLRDDKSYSFRAFMCTSGGCTLTKYSQSIKTHKNNTPVITGVVSGVIILHVIVVIVIILLKRREFLTSQDERNQNYEAINMDHMEGGEITPYDSLNTDQLGTVYSNEEDVVYEVIPADVSQQPQGDVYDYMDMDPRNKTYLALI